MTTGFLLLTHNNPAQILRLVRKLDEMFGGPPIVCHHDFSQCPLDVKLFPGCMRFVLPHLETAWGRWSVVAATVRALRTVYEHSDPDWFVLLSGSDYPIKPAARIQADLAASLSDAFIQHEHIDPRHFGRAWHRTCRDRFFAKVISFPSLTRHFRPTRRSIRVTHPVLPLAFLPFSPTLRCFAGSQWFTGSRRAAKMILDFHDTRPRLARHYRGLSFTEESYFQTILGNAPGLSLRNDNLRYVRFVGERAHPETLTRNDLPSLLASSAHFARKFDPEVDARVLDDLDRETSG